MNPDDDPLDSLRDEGGEIPAPLIVAAQFCDKALGIEPAVNIPLEELVTPESLEQWDLHAVAAVLADHRPTNKVRYPSPQWALVLLARSIGETVDGRLVLAALGLFLRFDEESRRWFVHLLGPPDFPLDELP